MIPIKYLSLEEVIMLHQMSLKEFGGSDGIRDIGLLESAITQIQQSFDKEDLYPTLWDKAGALVYSLCNNHPFIDGNKRAAALCMLVFLDNNGYEVVVKQGQIYKMMMEVAKGLMLREKLSSWIRKNSRTLKS